MTKLTIISGFTIFATISNNLSFPIFLLKVSCPSWKQVNLKSILIFSNIWRLRKRLLLYIRFKCFKWYLIIDAGFHIDFVYLDFSVSIVFFSHRILSKILQNTTTSFPSPCTRGEELLQREWRDWIRASSRPSSCSSSLATHCSRSQTLSSAPTSPWKFTRTKFPPHLNCFVLEL